MTVHLKKTVAAKSVPITVVDAASFQQLLPALAPATARWLDTVGFQGKPDSHALIPAADGGLAQVFAGAAHADDPFALAALPTALPAGSYRIDDQGMSLSPECAALSWSMGGYAFDRYKARKRAPATLLLRWH